MMPKKENFSEWYPYILTRGDFIEYSEVSGCYILKPRAYKMWEIFQAWFNDKISKLGVKNCYFPLFIPEKLIRKEAKHIAGFEPEVAWITVGGHTELKEKLAIRPTSETIIYDAFSKWIRSWRNLPLKINQWCSVVRWEFAHPIPFLRTREFLWQEGHTAYATPEEAEKETYEILDLYERAYSELFAVPVIKGRKTEKEKFAGADYTLSLETFLPTGKAIQCCTSHCLGQNFSKAFDIQFLDKTGTKQYVWQNSWGFTTRSIGIAIIFHSDDKGLILPPAIAPEQIVIIPIFYGEKKEEIINKAKEIYAALSKSFRVELDGREEYTPGWKFNEWELKGVPLRIEIGLKEIAANEITVVRRDNGQKFSIALAKAKKEIKKILKQMQKDLYAKAKANLKNAIKKVFNFNEFLEALKNKKFILAPWCGQSDCEQLVKDKSEAKCITIPFEQEKLDALICFNCSRKAVCWTYWAKSV